MKKILIIDDEEKLRSLIARVITLEGFEVLEAGDIKSAVKKLDQSEIDVVLCDVKLPDGNGVDFLKTIREKYPLLETILLTAYGNIPDGVQAIKNGAFDYITKGDDNNKIIPLIYRALEKAELNKRVLSLEKQLGEKHSFEAIIGKSKKLLACIELARRVAPTDTTVLLLGETGTGKEVFAQSIHQASARSKKSFVAINCSAFGKDLLESEMFGHKAGAFTGATKDKKGLFEEAHNGTIFLDEIGELALDLQAKLLRVLESGAFIKVGDTQPTKVNVRIIAATNRDLQKEIASGDFRSDLFYRISVFQITIPALRERAGDIEALAETFAAQYALKTNKKIKSLSTDYVKALEKNVWNGNIRELKNVIERSVILTDGAVLDVESLPFELSLARNDGNDNLSAFSLASAEKLHFQKVLNYTNGNKAEAARLLEVGIATLYRKIEEYKL
ncbi:sigma-54-dependent transcriptional regulator [Dyadobacter psychrophilus]|uniref:DNA-binding transcriptional response regulator, NtrC family, contains REC, AAA-type ATPase, and a Fis-type DNA-binding domains n=1 Tax=Dyadobacter psychrophilus TaxID=651661 RepID=A0A1T5EP17_9BACT|nr:sigma-54 dependent transcriptional regulator [Dyadobacter psychrophilus]SKB85655.1 DNA-binding transcriptional response regulator, NtrC family, contains REC, AAA-type ATPase, and a Fis-type DNA-binding domains [Dyadobacter psychrophilus]